MEGRIVGLVGANGAGKTTTIKMLAGLLEPTSGTALLDGEATLTPATRRRIGYLPEESPLYDDMTPLAYLAFFGGLYDLPRKESRHRSEGLLNRLRLDAAAWKQPIGTLSRGMRRKVALARCFLHDPDLLLLDEPTSDLDPFTNADVEAFLREQRDAGKAILLSAHNLKQVEVLCDEILIMHGGRIVVRGSLEALRKEVGGQRYRVRATCAFPGSRPDGSNHVAVFPNFSEAEAALHAVKQEGGSVLEMTSLPPSLEEIMRRTTGARDG